MSGADTTYEMRNRGNQFCMLNVKRVHKISSESSSISILLNLGYIYNGANRGAVERGLEGFSPFVKIKRVVGSFSPPSVSIVY